MVKICTGVKQNIGFSISTVELLQSDLLGAEDNGSDNIKTKLL